MSYNNIADTDTAIDCVCNFAEPTCVIVKHANPCGVSSRKNLLDAYQSAFESDPTSAFGGIIAFNEKVSGEVAQRLIDNQFLEVVAAPAYSDESLKIFNPKIECPPKAPDARLSQSQSQTSRHQNQASPFTIASINEGTSAQVSLGCRG